MKRKTPAPKRGRTTARRPSRATRPASNAWTLRLYVAGQTPRSLTAFNNLKQLCEQHLPGRYHLEVIDLTHQPELGRLDQVVALPTLVRKLPQPVKRLIGDLSNLERVRLGIGLVESAFVA